MQNLTAAWLKGNQICEFSSSQSLRDSHMIKGTLTATVSSESWCFEHSKKSWGLISGLLRLRISKVLSLETINIFVFLGRTLVLQLVLCPTHHEVYVLIATGNLKKSFHRKAGWGKCSMDDSTSIFSWGNSITGACLTTWNDTMVSLNSAKDNSLKEFKLKQQEIFLVQQTVNHFTQVFNKKKMI